MSIRPLKWILLGPVLALLLLVHGFGETSGVPSEQPAQMWSRVHYDPNLTDPFFNSNKWSHPEWIQEEWDGHFFDRSIGKRLEKEPPRLKHTANCFSTSFGVKHLVRFCGAELPGANMIDLFISESNPSFNDSLRVQIRNGMFRCQYRALYKVILKGLIWTTRRQKLTLDKKAYRKGDVIKGRIGFECLEEETDPKVVEKYGRRPETITVEGVFKAIVE